MLKNGETSELINKGLITLIPKSGDHAKLGNWRPITLLGSLYKILAKTLARRLQVFLPRVIRPGETDFVEGRSILDNTFLAQEAKDWVEESNQDLILLLLDFEKAFDKIEWSFLFEALAKPRILPTMDPVGKFPVQISLVGHQIQWGGGEHLSPCQRGEARMPTLTLPLHPNYGCARSYAR
jgi:hypothetical protein